MQLGTVILIVVIFANFPAFGESANETEDSTTSEVQKILVDCNHSDYRTYLACLKRQKRHHLHTEPESVGENRNCMRKCDVDKCTTSSCMKNCYQRCFEKTKETHHVITEYSTNCSPDENCHEERQGVINITANIDIKNIMENPSATIPPQPAPKEYVPSAPRETFTSVERTRNATCVSSGCYVMGILMVPQVQYAPPVNNYPGNFGCNQWSCPNSYQVHPLLAGLPTCPGRNAKYFNAGYFCSKSFHPTARLAATRLCVTDVTSAVTRIPKEANPPVTATYPVSEDLRKKRCRSPYCVGGLQ